MSIKGYVSELENIKQEIMLSRSRIKKLNTRAHELEALISVQLKEMNLPGFKHNNIAIVLEQKPTYAKRSTVDKDNDLIEFFRNLGVDNPENAVNELKKTNKREPVDNVDVVKFKKINNRKNQ
jgi:hypothetical protein